jgi:hypothetical protein
MLHDSSGVEDDRRATARWAATITLHRNAVIADDLDVREFFRLESHRESYSRYLNSETRRVLKVLSNFEFDGEIRPSQLVDLARGSEFINLIESRLASLPNPNESRRGDALPLLTADADDTWSAF